MVFLKKRSSGIMAVVLASILWGTTGVSATFAPKVSALAIGSAAMGIGGILQALMAIRPICQNRYAIGKQWGWVLMGALTIMVYPLAFYSSMHVAGVTVGTVVSIGSAPIFSALIERLLDGNRITRQWMVGASLGIGGILCLSFAENQGQAVLANLSVSSAFIGIMLGLLAGLTYAFYSWVARHLMQKAIPAKAAMGTLFGVGGLFLFPVLLMTGKEFLVSWGNIGVGLYMGFVPMFIGYLCFGYGLARISSSLAITITLLEPVVAAILAGWVVGEKIFFLGWVGIALIFSCLICVTIPVRWCKSSSL